VTGSPLRVLRALVPQVRASASASLRGLGRDRGYLGGHHADGAATAAGAELDLPGHKGEQRVIPATADADAGVEVGAVLTHDDLAGANYLTAEALHAEAL
jgi:hypothetical protein